MTNPFGKAWINARSTTFKREGRFTPLQWRRHCRRTFPFTAVQPEDAETHLEALRERLAVERRCLAYAMKQRHGPRSIAANRRQIDIVNTAIRNGEALLRENA